MKPIDASERIEALDLLRGFALLGILVINIQGFAMVTAAYMNPTAYGDLNHANLWVWILSHTFADQKFMTLFSLLFGAGILLFTTRAKDKADSVASLHYRRMGWLIAFGLLHAYVLWYGDILFTYGMCALIIYLFRNRSPLTLLIVGLIFLATASMIFMLIGWSIPYWSPEQYRELTQQFWVPNSEQVAKEIAIYRGTWWQQMAHRAPEAMGMQTWAFFTWSFWRAGGLMLIGMALFKWGVLSAKLSRRFYVWMIILGFSIGLPLITIGIFRNFSHNWLFDYSMFLGYQYNYWGSLCIAAAYIGIIMLIAQSPRCYRFTRPLVAVGRTAFSNYILHTIICTTIFYGHGLGLFGQLERIHQIAIVCGVWITQLILSSIWLKYFNFGPLEWLWRGLTYWKFQPLRK
jgi:uncharacterized protein